LRNKTKRSSEKKKKTTTKKVNGRLSECAAIVRGGRHTNTNTKNILVVVGRTTYLTTSSVF